VQEDNWTPTLRAQITRDWRIAAIRYRTYCYANWKGLQVVYRHPTDQTAEL
jgi:hypothetical protein